jgi:ribosomal protein S18 acetylase RimI-like enzyme
MDQITINRLSGFSPSTAAMLRSLAQQIGSNYQELTDDAIREMIDSSSHHIFVAQTGDDTIVGMVLIMIYRIPYVKKAYLEDLSVDASYRGKGIGTMLLEHAVSYAGDNGAAYIDFTSKPERISGNRLYEKLGFEKRQTNVYRKVFTYGKTK